MRDNLKQKHQKWLKWIKKIKNEAVNIHFVNKMYWELQEIIKNNNEVNKPNELFFYLHQTYTLSILSLIRRTIKPGNNSISFIGLLEEMINSPQAFSRKDFKAIYSNSIDYFKEKSDEWFDGWSGTNIDYIDPNVIQIDLDELKFKASNCLEHADRTIAHLDKRGASQPLLHDEINDITQFIFELMNKYHVLFTGESIAEPIFGNWKRIFENAWVQREEFDFMKEVN